MELTPEQQRVLGSLIEKSMTTPDYYPLSLNSLMAACNQSSSRTPVVNYSEEAVTDIVDGLRDVGLVRAVHRPGQRTVKYKHALDEALVLDAEQLALLAVLMLRGPQTAGELRARTTRYREFAGLEAVEAALDGLATRDEPLVRRLDRRPGEKESRWAHLLGSEQEAAAAGPPESGLPGQPDPVAELRATVSDIAAIAADLAARMERLEKALGVDPTGPRSLA